MVRAKSLEVRLEDTPNLRRCLQGMENYQQKEFQEKGEARSAEVPRQGGQRKFDVIKALWRANHL